MRLGRLRQWRNAPEADLSLSQLPVFFRNQIERPFRQLQGICELWRQLIPPDIAAHTRLDSFSRGILRVSVESSAWLYELDRLLRSGVERQLVTGYRGGGLRKVRLSVATIDAPGDSGERGEPGDAEAKPPAPTPRAAPAQPTTTAPRRRRRGSRGQP